MWQYTFFYLLCLNTIEFVELSVAFICNLKKKSNGYEQYEILFLIQS